MAWGEMLIKMFGRALLRRLKIKNMHVYICVVLPYLERFFLKKRKLNVNRIKLKSKNSNYSKTRN